MLKSQQTILAWAAPIAIWGLFMFPASAIAAPFSYLSTDTPLPIPPAGTSGTTVSHIIVPAGTGEGIIDDIDVSVDITHTFDGDLEISLTHVDTGTMVLLFDKHGGAGDDITTTFDDEAGSPIAAIF